MGDFDASPRSARTVADPSRREDDLRVVAAGRSPVDALAATALATIRDVSAEVGRLVRIVATRATDGTPVAPLLRVLLGDPSARLEPGAPDDPAWAERVFDAEQSLALSVQRLAAVEERCEQAEAAVRTAAEREHALQADLAAMIERACAERETLSRRADGMVAAAEQQRATIAREAEEARAALAAIQQASLAQRNELSTARSEAVRIGVLFDETQQARQQLDTELRAQRQRLAQAQERVRTLEIELARIGEDQRRKARTADAALGEAETRRQEELSALRLQHATERDRAQSLGDELLRIRTELAARDRREERLQHEVDSASTRADADREETVRRAQEMVQVAEHARAAAMSELEQLRGSLTGDRARILQIRAEQERAEQGAAEREVALTHARTTIEHLEAARVATASELERARARVTELERELLITQHEYRTVQRQVDKLCTAHDDLVDEHARIARHVEDARANETMLREGAQELRARIHELETERLRFAEGERQHGRTSVQHDEATARASELDTEVLSLRHWAATLESELAQATITLEQATMRERALQEALAASERSTTEHDDTLHEARALAETAESQRATAAAELEALRTSMASAQRVVLEAEEETRVARAEAERLALAHEALLASGARPADAAAPRAGVAKGSLPPKPDPGPVAIVAIASDSRVIAVLDGDVRWPETGGAEVKVLRPTADVVAALNQVGAGRCIANLATPGAIDAAASIRAAGNPIPLWGAIISLDGERGLSLGRIEVVTRPIAPDAVRIQCVSLAPKNARLLAIGSDSSTFIALRQGLMKAGMSVSIAWDLKQATELLDIVRPHMVVLDLALPPRGAASLVAGLARLETSPVLVLLPGTPEQVDAFSGAIAAFVPAEGARTPQNILRGVIDAKRA